jgi:hypothetical protein
MAGGVGEDGIDVEREGAVQVEGDSEGRVRIELQLALAIKGERDGDARQQAPELGKLDSFDEAGGDRSEEGVTGSELQLCAPGVVAGDGHGSRGDRCEPDVARLGEGREEVAQIVGLPKEAGAAKGLARHATIDKGDLVAPGVLDLQKLVAAEADRGRNATSQEQAEGEARRSDCVPKLCRLRVYEGLVQLQSFGGDGIPAELILDTTATVLAEPLAQSGIAGHTIDPGGEIG